VRHEGAVRLTVQGDAVAAVAVEVPSHRPHVRPAGFAEHQRLERLALVVDQPERRVHPVIQPDRRPTVSVPVPRHRRHIVSTGGRDTEEGRRRSVLGRCGERARLRDIPTHRVGPIGAGRREGTINDHAVQAAADRRLIPLHQVRVRVDGARLVA
jgi:hypothetical protein